MQTISYHAFNDENRNSLFACNRRAEAAPLLINCAGVTNAHWRFQTINTVGRVDYYLFYVKKGTMELQLENHIETISSGTLVCIPPNCPYSYIHQEDSELVYYWVHLTGSYARKLFEELEIAPLPLVRYLPQLSSPFEYQMLKIFDIFIKNGPYRDYELSHCMNAILIETAKSLSNVNEGEKTLSKSIKYIHQFYTTQIAIPELAKMEFLSVSRYMVLFKKIVRITPYQYILSLRLNSACEMLQNSDLSVGKIAELSGFQNGILFSKFFKKHFEISPLVYRKKHR